MGGKCEGCPENFRTFKITLPLARAAIRQVAHPSGDRESPDTSHVILFRLVFVLCLLE